MTSTQSGATSTTLPFREPEAELNQSTVQNVAASMSGTLQQSASTTEPFPPLETSHKKIQNASLHPLNTTAAQTDPTMASPHQATPVSASLRIQTDHIIEQEHARREAFAEYGKMSETPVQDMNYNAGLPVRNSSIRSAHNSRAHRTGSGSLSPASAVSSPGIGPLVDLTPLPSPISSWGSPKLWRSSMDSEPSTISQDVSAAEGDEPEVTPFNRAPSKKRKIPILNRGSNVEGPIYDAKAAAHARQRSLSDYVPDGMQIPRSRNVVVSTSVAPHPGQTISPPDDHMHREEYLAVERGLAITKPPTPPESSHSVDDGSSDNEILESASKKQTRSVIYEARTIRSGKFMKWRSVRELGHGTFSTVMLGTSKEINAGHSGEGSVDDSATDPSSLVAVKICQQGPAGGADEKKIGTSIKRELELMKAINHPSLVRLKAVNELERQTIIVENYCAGGDLFELASEKLELLSPSLIRRIFSELASAVRYLHLQYIVHRDIKLENVLVNLTTENISAIGDWSRYPAPVVTLTDLGLGRWIPKPPESPLLETRCGSDDYAAPEILLGNSYDGRSTDSWALGVLLYAIMEGRLPFDPVPGSRRSTPKSHKIARCQWQWVRWADEEGEWDPVKGKDLEGAKEIVDGLLAKERSRWNLARVESTDWIRGGINVEGGLRRPYDDDEAN